MLADNKLALNAGWDEELLGLELKELMESDIEFDVGLTGFSIAEVDQLVEGLAHEDVGDPADDRLPDPSWVAARCRPGHMWRLGSHRLICSDARDPLVIAALMDDDKCEMVFTDPPYNVPIEGNVSGLGKIRHGEFAMASGEMTRDQFTAFLSSTFANLVAHSFDGSIHFVCMDWRHMGEMMEAGAANYSELKNLIVWIKDNGGMGTFYRSRHEQIFVFKSGTAPHINSFELGQHGAAAPTYGNIAASTPSNRIGSMNLPCTQPSSRWRWSPTRSKASRVAAELCSTRSPAPARR